MIVKAIYDKHVWLLKKDGRFDFFNDGKDTLRWLREVWAWNKDHKARRIADKLARKIAAWEKKRNQDLKDERGRQTAIKILDKMARER